MIQSRPAAESWHLDRRIPIALIVTIFVQSAGIIWWAATISSRVSTLEEAAVTRMDERDRLIILETELKAVNATLQRIERRLDGDSISSRR